MSKTARFRRVFYFLLLVLFSLSVRAQPAFQVDDLNTARGGGMNEGVYYSPPFAALGGTVVFGASDGIHGFEPWRTDGTEAGTRRIADVCPGSCSSVPESFTVVGGTVFFLADDGLHGEALWKSDGTETGTVLVKDLSPVDGYVSNHSLAEVNGLLLFARSGFGFEAELWRSDGTAAGTFMLASLERYKPFWPQVRLGGKLFFITQDTDHGRELWTTDGTVAGTTLLKDIAPGPAHGLLDDGVGAVAGGKVFFQAAGTSGFELWVSDGTEAGTVLVKAITPGPGFTTMRDLTARGGEVFFVVGRNSSADELWGSDGTAGGTRLIKSVPRDARQMTIAGGRLFFLTGFCDLWTSDGTEAGTLLAKSSVFCDAPLADNGSELLFFGADPVHGGEPWKSDGTPAGTSLIADIHPGPGTSFTYPATHSLFLGGRWYFQAKRGEDTGVQLWITDGTAAGTRMLRINHQASGFELSPSGKLWGPRAFLDVDGTLLFQGDDGATGGELWRSDGTAAGTHLVKDLWSGPGSSLPGELTRVGDTVFFRSQAGAGGLSLWRTDGTQPGTQLVFYSSRYPTTGGFSPRDLTPFGSELLYLDLWGGSSDHLLRTDGTWLGTGAVGVAPGTTFPDYVDSLVSVGDKVFLQADGNALWKSDGHDSGTIPLATVLNPFQYLLESSAARDGVLFFPGTTPANGEELWRSDGTEAGTFLAAETVPGPGSKPLGPFASTGSAVFFAAGGNELWKNDAGGTGLVRALPGNPDIGVRSLTALGNKVYFSYDDGVHGRELWVSDGTQAGTRMVEDILPGPGSSHPRDLRVEGNVLLFSASDGVHGFEPWRSKGAALGTRMLHDVAPGALPSSPTEFTASGPNVYLAANDGTTGFELWALPRPALLSTFSDVPAGHWSWGFVEALAASRLTSGCGQDHYCPEQLTGRSEAAAFLIKASHGPDFVPPPATGTVFNDAPVSYWASPWIEQLAADGVTAGCGNGNFCSEALLTRAEAAGLLLRARYGGGFMPPPATGAVFNDVPAGHWAARWIEQLAAEGATSGCGGGSYCPDRPVSRAEMAAFLTKLFQLPLP